MNYQEALTWIHSRLKFGIKPGIERMTWMLDQLGNPQKNLRAIHVVGTNGKGSVVNNLQHIFTAAGYHIGTFTSPYIVDFRERISLDGQLMPEEDLVACVELVKPIVESLPADLEAATEFETISLIMFLYFGRLHLVDLAVIEAGMGGRDDSTNLFQALAVVCPSIGLDHQAVLGQTYGQIAQNKAGVLKAGEPLVMAVQQEKARQAFLEHAQAVGSPVYEWQKDFEMSPSQNDWTFRNSRTSLTDLRLAMPGQHQVANAALAIETALLLKDRCPELSEAAIRQGLATAKWQGRTELLQPNLMIDGAHNNESVQALVDLIQNDYKGRKVHILFAAIDTKPVVSMLEKLAKLGQVQVTTFPYHNSLALDDYPEPYQRMADFETWLAQVYKADSADFYLITGSLYFISQVRKELLKNSPQ
ncbi:bifunctional folylpolyglutamate synthase/dihydrofolate synthase [Streptococcus sobrinus]|nr:folylpolyglutamate synthase/dihydrofolate synthase family protein [Streptococcus sobrinus]AWN20808.1 bifunctional folylpolyglutamate synthase/dihydrofolate synthase [Streptococcus sobrinus]AWN61632.1 bifunctional folylpolyglutamate synthase/dihydrofolate synthase [Streptococcus sobrinus]AWN63503.1 bifunctional folylpolyglutamate synthase/dihydrofolate synthase [Streptococcus sobrinus]EMP71917.1 dihydrofolate synthase [Streptococcus sobrinus DSM 20742 = ATCC 33478]OZV23607.1 bifunctional fol